jgi:hypothetical protein
MSSGLLSYLLLGLQRRARVVQTVLAEFRATRSRLVIHARCGNERPVRCCFETGSVLFMLV